MKTNYHQRNKSTKWRTVIVVLFVFVIVFYLLSFVRLPLVSFATPLWNAENKTTDALANSFSFLSSKSALIQENRELNFKLQSYEAERIAYVGWREREIELMNLLGRKGDREGIAASVIVHPPQSPYDVLVVDAGSSSGVLEGERVRMPEGPFLGTIVEVSANNAKVKLFSSSGTETNAVLERHNISIVLIGAGGGMFKFSLPRDAEVLPGDRILLADMEASLLAVVGDVSLKPTDSFKEVSAKGPTNIFNTRFVLISK